mmetsp:Transcript_4478/g.12864  ORF Transcript_4478/g.12864 Transcript_4478/m.12864 type:complete len:238 (-) Transcript_4478:444-1157(-)
MQLWVRWRWHDVLRGGRAGARTNGAGSHNHNNNDHKADDDDDDNNAGNDDVDSSDGDNGSDDSSDGESGQSGSSKNSSNSDNVLLDGEVIDAAALGGAGKEAPVMNLFAGNIQVMSNDSAAAGGNEQQEWANFANFDDAFASTNAAADQDPATEGFAPSGQVNDDMMFDSQDPQQSEQEQQEEQQPHTSPTEPSEFPLGENVDDNPEHDDEESSKLDKDSEPIAVKDPTDNDVEAAE